ncbi:MAG: aldehyde dehydrogenase family protein [Candidatus Neomarinimicrobiota bacterium]
MNTNEILSELGIEQINYGACSGAGTWSGSADGGILESINPATGEKLATVYQCSEEDYDKVVNNALEAFHSWRRVPAPVRGQLIREMGDALRKKKDLLGSLVTLEMGKIKQEGDGEVQEMIDVADFAVGQSRMLYGKTMHSERKDHRMYEQWHPLGPIGVISAFNFPVAVWAWNAFIAAITGDVVIWKPSSTVPLTAIAVQNICNRVMEKQGYTGIFNLIIGKGSTIGEKLINDKRIPLVSFTGSTSMGRHVSEVVAKRLGRTILELGGNNGIIVDETADLNMTIPAIVFGAVGTSGQRCTSTRRVIVHSSIEQDLVERLINAYKQISIGNPMDTNVVMGPVVNKGTLEIYKMALEDINKAGGEVVFGGNVIKGKGYFVEPTIVHARNDWEIVQKETFAPILYIISYSDLNEALGFHNRVPQGLSSAMFTTNLLNAERFLSSVGSDCGIANINIGTSGAEIGGAFGGEKETGGGRESGSDSWKQYMRRQTNTINWSKELPLAQGISFNITN